MIEINKLYNEDCLDTMAKMPDNFIDLVITSPPYDKLRKYGQKNGIRWDFDKFAEIAKQLTRILKKGGVIVWVVGDSTLKGSETGNSFKQALFFKEDCGLNLYDTMIFHKHGMPTDPRQRYYQRFEYMFVLSKGLPKTYNPIADVKSCGRKGANGTDRSFDHLSVTKKRYDIPEYSVRGNVWFYETRNMRTGHPASFPEQLAEDHIISWSNEGDLVYDPMCGSGQVPKMVIKNKRNWIASEISKEYCEEIILPRINCTY